MGKIRKSYDGKYEVLESVLPEGRMNEYSIIGFYGRTAIVYQYILTSRDGALLRPILVIESAAIQGAEFSTVIAAIFADVAVVMSRWAADTGKRWDGNQVVDGVIAERVKRQGGDEDERIDG